MRLKIDIESCDRCGTCISVCPCNALVLETLLTVVATACTQCGICVKTCPFGSLSIEAEK